MTARERFATGRRVRHLPRMGTAIRVAALVLLGAGAAHADRLSITDAGRVRATITQGAAFVERDGTTARLCVDFTDCVQLGARLVCRAAATTTSTTTSSTSTTTLPAAVCGDGVVEGAEACDCLPDTFGRCNPPGPWSVEPSSSGGCSDTLDGRHRYCASDCGSCLEAEPCADGQLLPGDQCDAWFGIDGDGCLAGGRCTVYDGVNCSCTAGMFP